MSITALLSEHWEVLPQMLISRGSVTQNHTLAILHNKHWTWGLEMW